MKAMFCLVALVLAAGGPLGVLHVLSGPAAAQPGGVKIETATDKTHADFLIGTELVGRYHFGPEVAKPYFWPLNAPGGVPVTRAWPMEKGQPGESTDHVHQKSAWFCHGDVIPEGIDVKQKIKGVAGVDFWSEGKGHGRIVCVERGKVQTAGRGLALHTRNEWRTADGQKILDEVRNITLHDLGSARLFVFDIDLHASTCPVTFGDTKEGSFAVRVHDQLRERGGQGKLSNAAGQSGEPNVWGRLSPWNDYSGPVGGKTVGIAIFDDPGNPSAACWHSRGYGLLAANPFGRAKSGFSAMKGKTDLVKLAKGEHLKLRYGILLHAGDVQEGKVAEHYAAFVKRSGLQ